MSSTTVRQQMQQFLQAGNITGMGKWYASEPMFAPGTDWDLAANGGWGAIGWPWISDESEKRLSLGAEQPGGPAAGQKEVTYKVSIVLLVRFRIGANLTGEDAWQAPLDTIIDGVKARLRSDPKAGTGAGLDGVIFEQSQEDGDLSVMRDMPQRVSGGVEVWQRVDTTVKEIITA